jgi:hypothetical protein
VAEYALVPFVFEAFTCQKYVEPRLSRLDCTEVPVMPERSNARVANVDESEIWMW